MYPALHLFGIHISTYALMTFIGVVAFFISFVLLSKKEGIERVSFNRMILVSLAGCGVIYLSALLFNTLFHSIEEKKFVFGGITWLGGVVGAFPFMIFMIHKIVPQAKGRAIAFFSVLIPGIVIGHAFGRLGCFFGGCCYGKVTNSVFGVVFPANSLAAFEYPAPNGKSLPVYPTQLFEAVFEGALFICMLLIPKKLKKYNAQIYMITYAIFRFSVEFLRGDDRGSTGFFLTPSQLLCVFLLIAGVLLILEESGVLFKKINEKRLVWQKEAEEAVREIGKQRKQEKALAFLRELASYREKGTLSEEEYERMKDEILKENGL